MLSKTNFADKFFVVGGTLGGNVASYVQRPLDDDLLHLALDGEYCNVLAARQMGKSSLMVRTAQKLRKAGVKVAIIDLTAIGSSVSASEWYFGLLSRLVRELKIEMDEQAWWRAMEAKSPVQRFSEFLRDVILEKIKGPVVIFIDEIDSTLKLDFTDDFFAAIRAAYNARSRDEAYKRLTFVLLGVARPGDLIKDRTRTPYNIGVNVDVTDFQLGELDSFRAVLDEYFPKQGREVLQWVLDWTGGQPYLTQKLCAEAANAVGESISKRDIDSLVEAIFLSDQARTETNLRAIRDRIQNNPHLMEMLGVYKRVLAGKQIAAEERSIAQNELKLTGLLRVSPQGILQVRNRIYGRIFDVNWAKNSIPASVSNRSLIAVISSVAVTALALAGFFYYRQVNQATEVQAQTYIEGFQNNPSQEVRITNLAGLFSLGGEYEDRALDLFNSLSYQEQLALFGLATPENVGDALVVVVNGVYQTVENNPDGSALLSAMAAALEKTTATGAVGLVIEINAWVDGRNAFLQGQYEVAAASLTNVLDRSEQRGNFNIEALLDRAQAYTALGQYDKALTDFDRVIELDNARAGEVNGILLREGNEALANYLQEHPGIYRNIENAVSVPTSTSVAPTAISLSTKIIDEFGVTMLLVPAGEFIAGMDPASAVEECKKYSDDCLERYFTGLGEVRTEYLDSFYIDEYEVTNALYRACVEAGKCSPPKRNSSATRATYFDNPAYNSYPVINIHKAEAMKYCEWRGARLPSDSEWEKAARGTDGRFYPWGNEFDPAFANYGGYQEDTSEVGNYPEGKSPYGLYDMLGNVYEWVEAQDDDRSIVVIGDYDVMGGHWGDTGPLSRAGGSLDGMWIFGVRCAKDAP